MFPDHDVFDGPNFDQTIFTSSKTCVIFHNDYLLHDTGSHPENSNRLIVMKDAIEKHEVGKSIDWLQPDLCEEADILRCHSEAQLEAIKFAAHKASESGGRLAYLDPDTPVSSGTWQAALRAVGGACHAVDQVLAGTYQTVWGLFRPPGHHATPDRSMGFCIFNNVACAAEYARVKHGLKRIMIVDIDLHHGNGTQDIFYSDAGVLYSSIHQCYHYPGTGFIDETGSGDGKGYTVNFPVLAGAGDGEFAIYGREVVAQIAWQFKPELLIISIGFDAHMKDPLGSLDVSTEYYGKMVTLFRAIATELGIGVFYALEGGYSLEALSESIVECMTASVATHFDPGGLPMPYRPPISSQDMLEDLRTTFKGIWNI
ncbi:histone deacetylase [bacterium]|nr:histone deacetylase [bacterium]